MEGPLQDFQQTRKGVLTVEDHQFSGRVVTGAWGNLWWIVERKGRGGRATPLERQGTDRHKCVCICVNVEKGKNFCFFQI